MLNSRYIHLHQALGLGIMWLNQRAHISAPKGSLKTSEASFCEAKTESTNQTKPSATSFAETKTSVTHANQVTPTTSPHPSTHLPHGNALAKIRQRNTPSQTAPTTQPIPSAQPQPLLHSPAPHPAKLLILSVCPSVDDMAAGKLFSGADGEMLHKMLKAIALPPAQAHFSTWLKNSPDFTPRPDAQTITAAAPSIAQEWQQTQAQAMLLLGDFFHRPEVQAALNQIAPTSVRYHIPHPMRLAGNPQLKRSAWETLQKLQAALK